MKNSVYHTNPEIAGNSVSRHKFRQFYYVAIQLIIFILLSLYGCHKKKETDEKESSPEIWETLLQSEIYYCSPALSPDEKTVYAGTSYGFLQVNSNDQAFAALETSTGKVRWLLQLGTREVRSSPAIASDSSIFFTVEIHDPTNGLSLGDELWHVSTKGQKLWSYNINPTMVTLEIGQSAPAIGQDGTIYAAGDRLWAFNPEGSVKWTKFGPGNEALRNAPVIGNDGRVYFVTHNIPLTALNPGDGSAIWSCDLGVNDHCVASPAIGSDGKIYVSTQPGILYAVTYEGQVAWTFTLASAGFSGTFRSSPAIDEDGTIYFGINTGNPSSAFFALNPDGSLKWIFEPEDLPPDVPGDHFDIYSSPAIGSDTAVYFGQEFGRVYALNTVDGSVKNMVTTNSGITWSSPVIDSKGVLYITDLSGRVYAIQTDSKGLSQSAPWPKFRFDDQNSGRIH
jgi:outer membrane protein assembly factor BamB